GPHATPRVRVLRRVQLRQLRASSPGAAQHDHRFAHWRSLHRSRGRRLEADGKPLSARQAADTTLACGDGTRDRAVQGQRAGDARRTPALVFSDTLSDGFRYARQVQFGETDMAGIVHFSWMYRYMEEAEHALWRAAGMHIARFGEETSWPRLSASFEFKNPLYFEDEFE